MALVPGPSRTSRRWLHVTAALFLSLGLLLTCALPAAAQKKKKNKKDTPITDNIGKPIIPMTDEQQIDYLLSAVLGTWQVGDVAKMHEYYTDDVSVVKGSWEPPSIGWANYVKLYEEQRSHMQQVRLDRMNTYIRVHGDTAWTNYQWEFSGVVNGELTGAHGQTTLVLIKVGNQWKIAHDHTSVVETRHGQPPGNSPPAAPSQPGKPSN